MNAARGEARLRVGGTDVLLRPSFAALVAAEQELGPLFVLVERAAEGRLSVVEMVGLFWHCATDKPATMTRDMLGEALVGIGLADVAPTLRILLGQILQGASPRAA